MLYHVIVSGRVSLDTVVEADDRSEAILEAQTYALNGCGEIDWEPVEIEVAYER